MISTAQVTHLRNRTLMGMALVMVIVWGLLVAGGTFGAGGLAAWTPAAHAAAIATRTGTTTTTTGTTTNDGVPANMEYEGDFVACGGYDQASLSRSWVGGTVMDVSWRCIEPSAPSASGVHRYTFAAYDRELAAWASRGKTVALVFRYVSGYTRVGSGCSDTTSDELTPQWAIDQLVASGQMACDTGQHAYVPDWWAPRFVGDVRAALAALIAHMAASPDAAAIAYVRVGTGIGGESYPLHAGASSTDNCTFAGGTREGCWNWMRGLEGPARCTAAAWYGWVTGLLAQVQADLAAAAPSPLSSRPLVHGASVVQDGTGAAASGSGCVDPVTGATNESYAELIAFWAGAHGIGVGYQALEPGFTYGNAPAIDRTFTRRWPTLLRQFQPQNAGYGPSTSGMTATAYCYGGGDGGVSGTIPARSGPEAVTVEWYHQTLDQVTAGQQAALAAYASWQSGGAAPPAALCAQV